MRIATTYTAQLKGLDAETISCEVDISNGLHAFSIVGLGDRAVGEAKDRISAAIKNSGYVSPKQKNQKVVISLAPARIRKEGTSFDVAMAVAYLIAAGEISWKSSGKTLLFGELSLDGGVRKVDGLLPMLCQAAEKGFTEAIVPKENVGEATLATDIRIYAASTLSEIAGHISGERPLPQATHSISITSGTTGGSAESAPENPFTDSATDMSTIRGNGMAKRCLEIAAAGGHHLIMCGPPGTGKTMLARSIPTIMPPLSPTQSLEVTGIYSAARMLGSFENGAVRWPPFRSPHHTSSISAVLGGGQVPRPGEVTLAQHGILFLDEFPEFDRRVIEGLRQPLEDRVINLSRAKAVITYPARCTFIGAMNPCPCGKEEGKGCTCTKAMRADYRRKISAPILDRIDIWVDIHSVDHEKLTARNEDSIEESSASIQKRVARAWLRQSKRFTKIEHALHRALHRNADMTASIIKACEMTPEARSILRELSQKLDLSGRAVHRIIKVARTIADLEESVDQSEAIQMKHILEAVQYRKRG